MAYRDNWLRHLLAPFTGEGLSNFLARDFWSRQEDLWEPAAPVRWRWVKLVWVYAASVFAQFTFAIIIAGTVIEFFKDVPAYLWWIVVGGGTAAMLLFAILVATATYVDIRRKARRSAAES